MRSARKLGVALAALLAALFGLVVPSGAGAASPSILVSRVVTSARVMALTFDMGSDAANVSRILTALSGSGVKATFFVTGRAAMTYPAAVRSVIASGHEIGNHSYSHRNFTGLTATQIADDLSRAATAIRETTGQPPKPFFRPPDGAYNAAVLQAVGNAGYRHTIMWTIDTVDWQGLSSTAIRDRVVSRAVPGGIVLMHVGAGASGTPGALPGMIASLKAAGYQFVTISQLLGAPSTGQTVHVVQSGDTLYRIALRYGVTVSAIVAANHLSNADLIHVGQVLVIPTSPPPTSPPPTSPPPTSPVLYTVRSGDNLYRIALRYGVTVSSIVAANHLANANVIRVGQVLTIPIGAPPTSPPPTSPVLYTVRSGDNLYRIALRYGVTVSAIVAANHLSNANVIRVGQVLTIPK
jgi:peptidoglycan/xylan/chitin deacetylase (PgdA/CDA1 family)